MAAGVIHFARATLLATVTARRYGMERADWLDERVDPADARFLMVTAITHHRFSSPIWGAREVRKLQTELAEITKHASEILREHQATAKRQKRTPSPWRGVMWAPRLVRRTGGSTPWRGVMWAPAW
jgi:hypothetical protein